jgi:hypothetical protein
MLLMMLDAYHARTEDVFGARSMEHGARENFGIFKILKKKDCMRCGMADSMQHTIMNELNNLYTMNDAIQCE